MRAKLARKIRKLALKSFWNATYLSLLPII